jgi:hypothetical protein
MQRKRSATDKAKELGSDDAPTETRKQAFDQPESASSSATAAPQHSPGNVGTINVL